MPLWKDVVTLGASRRLENAMNEYKLVVANYNKIFHVMESHRVALNEQLNELVRLKQECIASLKQTEKIVKTVERGQSTRNNGRNDLQHVNFDTVRQTVSVAEAALGLSSGLSAGIGTAFGAWALVSTFGAASTGTAIASLSGVAATNATLAWLGGGALAAGGGGMALGATVLGGLVVIPALIVMGVVSHFFVSGKIIEINKEKDKVSRHIADVKNNISRMKDLKREATTLTRRLRRAKSRFDRIFNRIYKKLFESGKRLGFIPISPRYRAKKLRFISDLATEFSDLVGTTIL